MNLAMIRRAAALGYDSIVGVSVPFIGAGLGFAGAMINPFTLGIAQGICELPIYSGMLYRIVVWLVVTAAGICMVMRYASKIKKDPASSPVFELDRSRALRTEGPEESFSWRRRAVLFIFIELNSMRSVT